VVFDSRKREETMTKLLIGVLAAALLIPAGWALAGGLSDDSRDGLASTVGSTTTTTQTTTTDRDRRADRADRGRRHRGRKARPQRADRAREARGRAREAGEDVRGPCDEAEHRNDPRCTGAARGDHDRSGPGRGGDDDRRGGDDDDRSGPGGGRGSDD
jgi:transcription termination factor Rho